MKLNFWLHTGCVNNVPDGTFSSKKKKKKYQIFLFLFVLEMTWWNRSFPGR
jgi:hypothetical protein